jgi:uncharacterized glyoxalase superfamily protein PhnB
MAITIHSSFLPQLDPAASLAFGVNFATEDLDGTFADLESSGVDIVQEPIVQDYGVRDAAVRDPAGNLIRIQELTKGQH